MNCDPVVSLARSTKEKAMIEGPPRAEIPDPAIWIHASNEDPDWRPGAWSCRKISVVLKHAREHVRNLFRNEFGEPNEEGCQLAYRDLTLAKSEIDAHLGEAQR
jgi:hypothetical protein